MYLGGLSQNNITTHHCQIQHSWENCKQLLDADHTIGAGKGSLIYGFKKIMTSSLPFKQQLSNPAWPEQVLQCSLCLLRFRKVLRGSSKTQLMERDTLIGQQQITSLIPCPWNKWWWKVTCPAGTSSCPWWPDGPFLEWLSLWKVVVHVFLDALCYHMKLKIWQLLIKQDHYLIIIFGWGIAR